jgi:hypothetical protein
VSRQGKESQMTAEEFTAAGELLFGRWFKSPLARALGRNRSMIRKYSSGEQRIRPGFAAEIRSIVNIGPVGTAIRNSIKKSMPEIPPFTAHRTAKQILLDLISLGMVAENSLCDNEDAGSSRRKRSGIE